MIKVEFNITIARKHIIKIHEKLKHKNAVFNYHYNGITAASVPRTAILSNTFLLIAPSFKKLYSLFVATVIVTVKLYVALKSSDAYGTLPTGRSQRPPANPRRDQYLGSPSTETCGFRDKTKPETSLKLLSTLSSFDTISL